MFMIAFLSIYNAQHLIMLHCANNNLELAGVIYYRRQNTLTEQSVTLIDREVKSQCRKVLLYILVILSFLILKGLCNVYEAMKYFE